MAIRSCVRAVLHKWRKNLNQKTNFAPNNLRMFGHLRMFADVNQFKHPQAFCQRIHWSIVSSADVADVISSLWVWVGKHMCFTRIWNRIGKHPQHPQHPQTGSTQWKVTTMCNVMLAEFETRPLTERNRLRT